MGGVLDVHVHDLPNLVTFPEIMGLPDGGNINCTFAYFWEHIELEMAEVIITSFRNFSIVQH